MNLLLVKKNPFLMHAISIKMGLWMLAGFISFFLLMYSVGLGHRIELHIVNSIIQVFCLYRAIKLYYTLHPENINNYLLGVAQGMWATLIGVGGFAVFMILFLSMNSGLMDSIRQNSSMGEYLNPFSANLFIMAEGLVISLIVSYIVTRIVGLTIKSD